MVDIDSEFPGNRASSHESASSSTMASGPERDEQVKRQFRPRHFSAIATISEYIEGRFGPRNRMFLAIVTLGTYIVGKTSATLYAGALVFEVMFPTAKQGANAGSAGHSSTEGPSWTLYLWCCLLVALTSMYTILGGLRAVMVTDAAQLTIFFLGGLIGLSIAMNAIGGYQGLKEAVPDHFLHVYRTEGPYASPSPLGIIVISLWYWDFDQFMVQRVLAGRSSWDTRQGTLMAGFLKIWGPFLVCFPGMVARGLL